MSQLHTFIDPTSTTQLLNDLSLAVDEAKLVRTIISLADQIYKIETVSGPSKRTQYLRKEMANLENQLSIARQNNQQDATAE